MIEINGMRTYNRSWSRYRQFRITGLDLHDAKEVTVRVLKRDGRDNCDCNYEGKCADCGYDPTTCCKTVYLRHGDEEYLDFRAKPGTKEKEEPRLVSTSPIIFFASPLSDRADVNNEATAVDDVSTESESEDEGTKEPVPPPIPRLPACHFEFDWVGAVVGSTLRCQVFYEDLDLKKIELEDNAQLKLKLICEPPPAELTQSDKIAHLTVKAFVGLGDEKKLMLRAGIEIHSIELGERIILSRVRND